MLYQIALLLHVLGATIWTGGHLVLAIAVLPLALKQRSPQLLLQFESRFERIGMPALITQVLTGVFMAETMLRANGGWFDFAHPISRLVSIKLILLGLTILIALDARLRLIPRLTAEQLPELAWHIIPVTIISVLFVIIGVSFRTGWFF